jgi:selenocysteine-specific elongation factor
MIVGTAGHIDHGKTALVRSLTGVDADRLKEEKERGVTIDLGFAYMPVADKETIGFVDVPGHEKFIHNMLAGAVSVDFALLVIAADDGVMPQTREHVAILDLLGVGDAAVALTKIDLVPHERLDAAKGEIAELLSGLRMSSAPIFPVSNVTGVGVAQLRDSLVAAAAHRRAKGDAGLFRLAVDRSFALRGAGTVVTGAVLSGRVATGDPVVVSPSRLIARVRSIHAQNLESPEGRAGQRCALNLSGEGVAKTAIHRGDVVMAPALHAPAARFDATVKLLSSETRPIATWAPARLHIGAAEAGARIVPLSADSIAPGGQAFAQIVTDREIAACVGDRFILRDVSAQRTIGGGRVIDLRAPARKRRAPERLAQLKALAIEAPAESLAALLGCAPHFVELAGFLRDRALPPDLAGDFAQKLDLVLLAAGDARIAMTARAFARLRADLLEAVATFHDANPDLAGIGTEKLRLSLQPRLPAEAFKAALAIFAKEGAIFLQGAWVRLPTHQARLTEIDAQRWREAQLLLGGEERFRPPRVRDIARLKDWPEADVRRLLKTQGRMGHVDEIAHDHFFLRETTSEMVDIVSRLAAGPPHGEISAAQFRDEVQNGRKVAIQILEFFDRHGVTLRRGDLRRLNPHRLDLFRVAPSAAGGEH